MEHLSIIVRWNRNEKIYRMGWLIWVFSDLRRHGDKNFGEIGQVPISP